MTARARGARAGPSNRTARWRCGRGRPKDSGPSRSSCLPGDNLNTHFRAFTTAQAWLLGFQLPSYAPDLNPAAKGSGPCPGPASSPARRRQLRPSGPGSYGTARCESRNADRSAGSAAEASDHQDQDPRRAEYRVLIGILLDPIQVRMHADRRVGARLFGRWRGISAASVWPIGWSPVLYIYTSHPWGECPHLPRVARLAR
jgi:hypothetical protein